MALINENQKPWSRPISQSEWERIFPPEQKSPAKDLRLKQQMERKQDPKAPAPRV